MLYHPDCYKIKRTETLHSLGIYEKTLLTEATRKMNQFRNVISSDKMKDYEAFNPAWGARARKRLLITFKRAAPE